MRRGSKAETGDLTFRIRMCVLRMPCAAMRPMMVDSIDFYHIGIEIGAFAELRRAQSARGLARICIADWTTDRIRIRRRRFARKRHEISGPDARAARPCRETAARASLAARAPRGASPTPSPPRARPCSRGRPCEDERGSPPPPPPAPPSLSCARRARDRGRRRVARARAHRVVSRATVTDPRKRFRGTGAEPKRWRLDCRRTTGCHVIFFFFYKRCALIRDAIRRARCRGEGMGRRAPPPMLILFPLSERAPGEGARGAVRFGGMTMEPFAGSF